MSTDQHVTEQTGNPRAQQDAVLFDRLQRFVDRQGVVVGAETLGVNYRTLSRCLENGRLSRRVREAARKLPEDDAEEQPPPAPGSQAPVGQRVEALEQAVGEMAGAQADIRARLARLEAAVGNRSAQQPMAESGEAGTTAGAGDDAEQHSQHPTAESGSDDGWTHPKRAHGMPRPGVVTLEVQDDEAVAFGPAAALMAEWRAIRNLSTDGQRRRPGKGPGAQMGARGRHDRRLRAYPAPRGGAAGR